METTEPNVKIYDNLHKSEEFIIAIGASAGGMEAIHKLFDNTLTDAVSYVIVQHLSPDHKSMMAELLVKHSKLKIYEVENNMDIKPNCVYVMPEGKNMTIVGGKLFLKERQVNTPNSAVDIFFNALAEDQGNKSVAIVLSGNGSDGTKGIAAIKKVGGMVIVQDPSSTEFNSMPKSAIESGFYDFILSPDLIPKQIISYIKQRTLSSTFADPLSEKDEASLLEVISLIRQHTPLDFTDYKRPTIVRRIIRRMIANNTAEISDYIKLLKSNQEEIDILAKEFLISVTKFFRDVEAFDIIRKNIIPAIVENKLLVDTLKIWVIGCATGEEAYSLAIIIKEHLMEIKRDMEVKIFASDIDKEALAKASKGFYPESINNDVSEKRLQTFFIKEADGYKIRDNIRNMIIFADHDIVHQPPYGKIDLISCRNLLIYLNPTLQKKIFSTLHFCLNVGGYLFLGPSEGIGILKDVFSEVDKKWKIYKNEEGNYKTGFAPYTPSHLEIKKHTYPITSFKSSKTNLPENLADIINHSHFQETGYQAGACIDENNKIILPFGEFEKYFLPKFFNNNLLELLPSELSIAAGTSIKRALLEKVKITMRGITYGEKDSARSVKILVKPFLPGKKPFQSIIIVYLGDEEREKEQDKIVEVFDKESHTQIYLSDLEQELAEVKARLHLAHEALEEYNGNIQSYNEELISGNEEMQSANEELQSINEELHTVNNEYQAKIKELAELNDDFNNYFKSTYNSQLYVDKDLLIKKFSPITIKQINIKENDIGRPLGDISTNIKSCTLIEDITKVIKTVSAFEKQVETNDGRWYSMMILPYIRSMDNNIDGAIITFNDITDIKKSKQLIETANNRLIKINDDHDTFIYAASHDLKAPLNNIEGLLSILKELKTIEEVKNLTLPIIQSVRKLKDTIDELADITQLENESEEATYVNLSHMVDEVKDAIKETLLSAKAKIRIDLKEKEVKFLKKNLRSIILNLISNAVKYRSTSRDLEITIKSERVDGFIVFSVEDNGIGIAKDKLSKVFSKFKRVHNLDTKIEGAGIGLYLVRKIVSNAGGEIEVESRLGKGSCFKIYFQD